ncbi:YbaB/EbfC family nucleoid-associated protein [Actinokineospora sp. G85]|uniref:YbaB/EbfC family nucleoid-associated protein n=1 Tax=Actinokineospora sp. G85 TaxID=3406626 RepID=UPI003C7244D4
MNDETYHLVVQIEEATATAQRRAEERAVARIEVPLGSDLGSITVGGYGQLLSVDLDPKTIRYTSEERLAEVLKSAINEAEGNARG